MRLWSTHGSPYHRRGTLSSSWITSFTQQHWLYSVGATIGSIAVKVELEQLAVSILDDPSVDRAMREAGFSGSRVKANVGKGALPEQSDSVRIHRSDGITSPCPVNKKVMATQTSPGAVWDVLHQPGVVPHGSLLSRPRYQR